MATIKLFCPKTIGLGIAFNKAFIAAGTSRSVFFTAIKTTEKVTLKNLPSFKVAFQSAYLQTLSEEVQKVLENKEMTGKAPVKTLTRMGKRTDKRGWIATVRMGAKEWMDNYELFLRGAGATVTKGKRAERTEFAKDVVYVYPRMAAYQKLDAPTTRQLEHRKLLQAVIDSAVSSCPQAKEEHAALVRKATKIVK
jgi:hypothetical protein